MEGLKSFPGDKRLSNTMYLEPTAPPRPESYHVNPPPPYEANPGRTMGAELENHYQTPVPSPRLVNLPEARPALPESKPEPDEEDEEDAMNRWVKNSLKGFNSNKWMNVKLVESSGCFGVFRTKKYNVTGQGGQLVATVKTDPSSCDCCVHLLFCGCLKKPRTFKVRDHVGNEVFHFRKATTCCRIKPSMDVTTGDGKPIGRIVKQCGIRPVLVTYDYNGSERFTLRGPWSAAMFRCGQMKFYAAGQTEDGKEVNVGKIQKNASCASVRFQTQEKGDRVTKVLLLAAAFMVEELYHRQGKNDKAVPE